MKVAKGLSDDDLVTAIKTNEKMDMALDFVYKNYYQMLKTIILTNNGNEADAEDMIQEVLVAFIDMVKRGKYRGEASVKSFLYTMTRNMWLTELRKRSSESRRNIYFETEKDDVEKDISHYLIYNEGLQLVSQLFEQLGDVCKKVLTLFYFKGLSMKEMLEHVNYENEQVLRNKKYKCQRELIKMVEGSPALYNNLKSALHHGRE